MGGRERLVGGGKGERRRLRHGFMLDMRGGFVRMESGGELKRGRWGVLVEGVVFLLVYAGRGYERDELRVIADGSRWSRFMASSKILGEEAAEGVGVGGGSAGAGAGTVGRGDGNGNAGVETG